MDPFQCAEWLLAGELAALLSEAARWDWSDDQQEAARLSRQLADDAYADRTLSERPELFDELRRAILFADSEWLVSGLLGRRNSPVSIDASHGLDRLDGWREEADRLFERLQRLVFPELGKNPQMPTTFFD